MKLDPEERVMLANMLEELEEIWPYKRISLPEHLIEKWNETIGKEKGQELREMAFTVAKDAEIDDDMLWDLMTKTYDVTRLDPDAEHNPPETGLEKRTLI